MIVTVLQFQTKNNLIPIYSGFFLNYFVMIIKEVRGKKPAIPEDCYIAENATSVGDVSVG